MRSSHAGVSTFNGSPSLSLADLSLSWNPGGSSPCRRRFQHMDDLKVALEELKEESESGKLLTPTALISEPRRGAPGYLIGAGIAGDHRHSQMVSGRPTNHVRFECGWGVANLCRAGRWRSTPATHQRSERKLYRELVARWPRNLFRLAA